MYIPKHNQIEDRATLISFMQTYSFGILITSENNIPIATHLPFIIEERKEELFIVSHFAKANPQWKNLSNHSILTIFSGPHAYISPSHYEKLENVPTWNYTAVHTYGTASLLVEQSQKAALLERTIQQYEPAYLKQWQSLADSNKYQEKMMNGIVAFEIKVNKLEGKFKLSQNRSVSEQKNIIDSFLKSNNTIENELGDFMKKNSNL
jgi:transcriptional regulator